MTTDESGILIDEAPDAVKPYISAMLGASGLSEFDAVTSVLFAIATHIDLEQYPILVYLGARGTGITYENKIVRGVVPREFFRAVENGVREAAESGYLAGFPVTDVKVTFYDGSFHEVDSSEVAFRMAAIFAFREGFQKAKPVLLEPIMNVEVLVPEEYLGDVLAQLNSRRAEIKGMEPKPGKAQAVKADVPLAEMFGYATDLRSASQGRGVFTMEFSYYSPLSETVSKKYI